MKDFQDTIDEIFNEIETQLSAKLLTDRFQIYSQILAHGDFGSRYTEWRNEADTVALRLVWDGKGSSLLVEESPFTITCNPNSWADISLGPVDRIKITDVSFCSLVIKDLVNEVK